ncbi:DUF4007 family protein [Undibacterium sp. KW1]|uniref:DUF4007 family protein n=1 Tax=Undibacterium sp. KW1 TaxID=2058624 RepID=UPI0013895210|nr:DUF4007 family protein [Undibacterium sp. KW1]
MTLIRFPSDIKPMFSGHETFPLRQLWLRKAFCEVERYGKYAPKGVFSNDDAIERFGVGKNMVSSIRHWALACDVIRECKDVEGFEPGIIGNLLFGSHACDPYLERDATIWLVHWLLAGRAKRSATWYVVFNYVQSQSFQPKDIVSLIDEYATANKSVRSDTTLTRDVEVCLRCYTSVALTNATEDSAEPLLSDLGLLSASGNTYHFHRGPQHSLPDGVFAFALLDFWRRWEQVTNTSQATLSFNMIAHEYGSPGRVFKLDEDSVSDRLSKIADITRNYLAWTDSSGVRQVSRLGSGSIDEAITNTLRSAYAR